MNENYLLEDDIKRKIRKLKKLELKIRFGSSEYQANNIKLVWDEFFDLNEVPKNVSRYSINQMTAMSKEELKESISEYFFFVYFRYYKENGIAGIQLYDPRILSQMGLPLDSGIEDIKRKFRELAKKYHPDTGGDSAKFIEMMDYYKKLIDK